MLTLFSPAYAQDRSTWQVIQEDIWNPNCVECHVAASTFAEQSGLVLTADEAYEQLINVVPNNASASADGLVRVGTEGLPSIYSSFLWEKINAPDQAHLFDDHPHYGTMMPLGLPVLTNGELNFIKEWILGGAPEDGQVADETLLEDTTRYEPPEFEVLAPPERGIQLHLGPFDVMPEFEREFYYYVDLDTTGDIYMERTEITLWPGSHHFIAYSFDSQLPSWLNVEPETYRDVRDSTGAYITPNLAATLYHTFGFGTQWPRMDYHFPPGIALRLNADFGLDLNSHYINRSDSTTTGEVYVNMHLVDPSELKAVAEILFLNNLQFSLPPHQVTTVERTYYTDVPINIFQLFSHAHEHMLEFRVEGVGGDMDGELLYIAYDWQHPPILQLDPPLRLESGDGLKLIATYDNWTDEPLEFGLLSEDEMMIMFGYYYTGEPLVTTAETPPLPQSFVLHQNYPNPFNPSTTIRFDLPADADVSLVIYNLLGRKVRTLVRGEVVSGTHEVVWDIMDETGSPVPSGIYFVRMATAGRSMIKKAVLLR